MPLIRYCSMVVFVWMPVIRALVGNVQQRHAGRFVNAAALCLDDPVSRSGRSCQGHVDQPMALASRKTARPDRRTFWAVQCDWLPLHKTHGAHRFGLDDAVVAPETGKPHDGIDDLDAGTGRLSRIHWPRGVAPMDIAVGRIRFFGAPSCSRNHWRSGDADIFRTARPSSSMNCWSSQGL